LARFIFESSNLGSVIISLGGGDELGDKAGLEFEEVFIEGGAGASKGSLKLGSDAFLFDNVRGDERLGGTGSDFEVLEGGVFIKDGGDS